MKIKYKLQQTGKATDFALVPDSYILAAGEFFSNSNELTEELVESLHTQEYKNTLVTEQNKQTAVKMLRETDHKVLLDYPYQADVPLWTTYRAKLRQVLAGSLSEIPAKPF